MTFWVAGAVVGSSLIGASAARSAAGAQSAAADQAAQLQRETAKEQLALQQRMYEEGVARQQPWLQAGQNALTQLQGRMGTVPAFTGKVDLTQDPGYAFRLSEGQKALERSAAARGGLLSGATGKALARFGQEMGSQEYQNAYNRALTQYNADVQREAAGYNRLASLAGVGQTTAQQLGAAGQNYATASGNIAGQMAGNVGEALTGAAAARASGYVGGANALTQGLGTYLNYQQGQNMLAGLRTPPGFNFTPGFGGYNYTYQNPGAVGPQLPPGP